MTRRLTGCVPIARAALVVTVPDMPYPSDLIDEVLAVGLLVVLVAVELCTLWAIHQRKRIRTRSKRPRSGRSARIAA